MKNLCKIIFGSWLLAFSSINAQVNLVYNGKFEILTLCPSDTMYSLTHSDLSYATNWFVGSLSPDLFNICSTDLYNVPHTFNGYQQDCCGGNGFAGEFVFYVAGGAYTQREYIYTKLTHTLQAGHTYIASMYVSNDDNWNNPIITMGMLFTDTATILPTGNQYLIETTPQVRSNVLLSDTLNWMLVQDTFIATGNEIYLTINNFNSDSTCGVVSGSPRQSYYYIDGVSVYDITGDSCNNYWDAGFDKHILPGDSIRLGAMNTDNSIYAWVNSTNGATHLSSNSDSHPWSKPTQTTTYYVTKTCPNNNVFIDTVTVYIESTVGIKQIKNIADKFDIQVYPNPNVGKEVFINTTDLANGNINIKLTDLEGRTVYESDNNISAGSTNFKLTEIKNGVYFVHITNKTTGEKVIKKLVIQY